MSTTYNTITMTMRKLFFCLALSIGLVSCIQSEEPNSEADIETCTVVEDLTNPKGSILIKDPMVDENRITIMTKVDADLSNVKIEFTLTSGATINPPSGTARDFSSPQTYTVTSEDGKWQKIYTVSCNTNEMQTIYEFETCELIASGKYYEFFELVGEEKQYIWDSGNKSVAIIFGSKKPEEYPTSSYSEGRPDNEGEPSKCVKLQTVSTGILGQLAGMRLAAGNLFIGEFESNNAMSKPLEAPHFGRPFSKVPKRLTGYYKYKAGATLKDKSGKAIADQKDSLDIYAVFYETDEEVKYLNGTNSITSPNIVSLARIAAKDKKEVEEWTDDWVYFDIPFEPQNDRVVDPQKLKNSQYAISLVFTSSIAGASFQGAEGSMLLVDEVRLISVDSEDHTNQ